MDCEKFDRIVLDLLYGELDELTAAAAKRHMEHCARCRNIDASLRATREVGTLPLADAPEGLELRILEAERRATELLPLRKRLGRGMSLLAGYAMRPQLAMAALLMLMIGSSLLFLRAQPGDRGHVLVTERGVPESDNDSVAVTAKTNELPPLDGARAAAARNPRSLDEAVARHDRSADAKGEARAAAPAATAAPAPVVGALNDQVGQAFATPTSDDKADDSASEGSSDTDASYNAAMAAYRDGRYSEAERRFAAIASQGGSHAASAALYEVQALRMVSGCPAAAPRFDDVHSRYPGSVGNDAAWQAADCFRSLGDVARARQDYQDLLSDPNYKARAQDALAELDQNVQAQEVAARKAAAPAKAKASVAAGAPAGPPPAEAAKPSPPSP
ncbi:MAG TPA: zf-HC2 domain-containing protein [Polyangiaceae bacterium]